MKRNIKKNDLIYILSLLLLLFIIILFKIIFIKEGARNRRKTVEESPIQTSTEPPTSTNPPISNSPSKLDLSRNQIDIYINKVSTTSPYQKILDEDIATLQNYQNMLAQEQDKYSFNIKQGVTNEILNEIKQSMITLEKSINEYQEKISQDKQLILQNP